MVPQGSIDRVGSSHDCWIEGVVAQRVPDHGAPSLGDDMDFSASADRGLNPKFRLSVQQGCRRSTGQPPVVAADRIKRQEHYEELSQDRQPVVRRCGADRRSRSGRRADGGDRGGDRGPQSDALLPSRGKNAVLEVLLTDFLELIRGDVGSRWRDPRTRRSDSVRPSRHRYRSCSSTRTYAAHRSATWVAPPASPTSPSPSTPPSSPLSGSCSCRASRTARCAASRIRHR